MLIKNPPERVDFLMQNEKCRMQNYGQFPAKPGICIVGNGVLDITKQFLLAIFKKVWENILAIQVNNPYGKCVFLLLVKIQALFCTLCCEDSTCVATRSHVFFMRGFATHFFIWGDFCEFKT